MNQDYVIRRILLEEEVNQIKNIQKAAPEFYANYPKHIEWLDMALAEILLGKRVAFGVFHASVDKFMQAKTFRILSLCVFIHGTVPLYSGTQTNLIVRIGLSTIFLLIKYLYTLASSSKPADPLALSFAL